MQQGNQLKSGRKIAIVSPHLDDVVLSCFEHMQMLVLDGIDVTILNVFSRYRNEGVVSPFLTHYMAAVGCDTPEEYEEMRKAEDRNALEVLGIMSVCLDFIDAGFRGVKGRPEFGSLSELCQGLIRQTDCQLVDKLMDALQNFAEYETVLIPLGVGNHIDHLLSRVAAEKLWKPHQRQYYADIPYALRPWKWRRKDIDQMFNSKVSIKWTSPQKIHAMKCYESQLPFVLPYCKRFPEIVFSSV